MKELQKAAGLFEVNVPEFKQLLACRREIGLLKTLWDMITIVRSSFEEWNTTLWKDINVENMEMECKKFVKVSGSGGSGKRRGRKEEKWGGKRRRSNGDVVYVYVGVCMSYPSPICTVKYKPHKAALALYQHHMTTPPSCIS